MPLTFTRVKIAALAGSMVWMGLAFAQGEHDNAAAIRALQEKLQSHLIVAQDDYSKMVDVERRVSVIEAGARADRMDARVARMESSIESLHSMFWGIMIPVLLMGAESLLRLAAAAKKRTGSITG